MSSSSLGTYFLPKVEPQRDKYEEGQLPCKVQLGLNSVTREGASLGIIGI